MSITDLLFDKWNDKNKKAHTGVKGKNRIPKKAQHGKNENGAKQNSIFKHENGEIWI
jgi:hypothetical protein